LFGSRLPEAIAETYREDWKETGIAEVVVVTHFEGCEVLLEARVLIDSLAAHRGWEVGIAGAPCERHLEAGLAYIVEAHLNGDAEVAAIARNQVAEAEAEARRDLAKVDASRAAERVRVAADIVLTVQGNRAARRNNSGRENAVVVAHDQLRA